MRSLLRLLAFCVVLGSSFSLYADLVPATLLPNNLTTTSDNGSGGAFMGAADASPEAIGAWTPQTSVSGAASCNAAENANCLSTLDFVKMPDGPSLLGFVAPGGRPLPNNLPEPSTYLLIGGALPLVWRRVKGYLK